MRTSLIFLMLFVVVSRAQNVEPPDCSNQRTTPFCSCIGRDQSEYSVSSYTLGGVKGTAVYTFSFTGNSDTVITAQEKVVSILRTTLFVNGEQEAATQIKLDQITTLPAGPGPVDFGYNDNGYFFTFLISNYPPIPPGGTSIETFFQFQFFDQNDVQLACIRTIVYGGYPGSPPTLFTS